jgi:hypothetical protein
MNISPQEWINKLNSQQRMHMIELHMNPINPKHIQSYLAGKIIKTSTNEALERAKAIIGEDAINKSLGHSRDSAFSDPTPGQEYTPTGGIGGRDDTMRELNNDPTYVRQNMMREMDDYASSTGNMSSVALGSSSGLMDFGAPKQTMNNNNNKLNEAATAGQNLATNYYNAFIKSLQNPNTQSHYAVYKALKALLEQEKKLENSQLLQPYQKGVNQVAKQMYNKLTNQLHD